jgi:hypothetical protein
MMLILLLLLLQHKEVIVPYLLKLLKGLESVIWNDEVKLHETDRKSRV